ncbi:MAG: hypothetical protein R3B47_14355 [Bacteroidia bacterium]
MEKVADHIGKTARHLNELDNSAGAWAIRQREEPYKAERVAILEIANDQLEDFQACA